MPKEDKTKVAGPLTCDSFTNITGEALPCYCDVRSKGRLTTNGLCRRKGTTKYAAGLIDIGGLCVGNAAVQGTIRSHCLSLLMFKTGGTCVANELLYEDVLPPPKITSAGVYLASLDCGNQLSGQCICAPNPFNVSIRAGQRANEVVYFNSKDEPVFVGHCSMNERHLQESYCSTPPVWSAPRCMHSTGGIGWTRSYDYTGCVGYEWKKNTTKCGQYAIHVEGKGGSACFGYEKGGWIQHNDRPWVKYDGVNAVAGPSENEVLSLPRVVIMPGEWFPERVK